jgi:putative peptide zinc metalloprotease protein
MRFGPTSLKASRILAKGLRRPKFRTDLRVSEQTIAGETSYVVKVEETSSYNRYGVSEYGLLALCDGTRTAAEVAAEWNRLHPEDTFDDAQVLEFFEGVESSVWEQSAGEKNLAVLERIRDDRRSRVDQSNILYISFRAWDPNVTLAKMDKYLGWMFTLGFVYFSIVLFITAAYLLAGDWAQVQRDTLSLYSFDDKTAYDIWIFWFLMLGLGGVHELAHGLTCKHFGGDVHQMGLLLIYFTPAFFTDTTDILLFDRTSRRQWVVFAGIWIELVVCSIATLFWRFTVPGSTANDFAYKLMLLSGIQAALINLNPLIKADGYYALAQFLQIDNLREDSFAYIRALSRRHILREDIELPAASRRQRRIFVVFGVAAMLYSALLLFITALFLRNVLVSKFGNWGYAFTVVVLYFFFGKGIRKVVPSVRAWMREKREEYMAWKMTRRQQAGALAVVVLFLIPPIPTKIASDFVLEPGRSAHIRAEVPGTVRQILVKQGDTVQAGQQIAVLDNSDLVASAHALALQLALASSAVRLAESRPDTSSAAAAIQEQGRLQREYSVAQAQADSLEIRAPFAGIVSSPIIEKSGQNLAAGDDLCEVVDRTSLKARILVRDWELQEAPEGARVQLKVVPFPFRTYTGQVERIMPAAAEDRPVAQPAKLERMGQQLANYFAVVMVFPNPDGSLTEGMTGTAKIAGRWYPLAWQAGRAVRRWVDSQFW